MNSRCPSCGSEVKESDTRCPFCSWDFSAKRRVPSSKAEPRKPAQPPPAKAAEPEPPPVPGLGLKSLPKISIDQAGPAAPGPAAPGEPPFTLPSLPPAGSLDLPAAPAPAPVRPPEIEEVRLDLDAEPPPAPLPPPAAVPPETASPGLETSAAPNPPEAEPNFEVTSAAPAREPLAAEPGRAPAPPALPSFAAPLSTSAPAHPRKPARFSPVVLAAAAGAGLGFLSVGVVLVSLRSAPAPQPEARPSGAPVFASRPAEERVLIPGPKDAETAPAPGAPPGAEPKASPRPDFGAPAPAPLPAPAASPRPAPLPPAAAALPAPAPKPEPRNTATFSAPPSPAAPAQPAPKPVPRAAPEPAAPRPKELGWQFEGAVYDVISLQPVFAAHLRFLDNKGETVGQTTTGDGGRYRVSLPPAAGGYTLTVSQPDYTEKYIDEIDPPFREVDREQRLLLSESAARNRPWVGVLKKTVRRDFVMVPRSPEEP